MCLEVCKPFVIIRSMNESDLQIKLGEITSAMMAYLSDKLCPDLNNPPASYDYRGIEIPLECFYLNMPLFWQPRPGAKIDGAHDYRASESYVLRPDNERIPVSGSAVSQAAIVHEESTKRHEILLPAFVRSGNTIFADDDFFPPDSFFVREDLDGLTFIRMVDLYRTFGMFPENLYSSGLSAVMQSYDFRGRRIVDFGCGEASQLLLAGILGADSGIGIDLPSYVDEDFRTRHQQNLAMNKLDMRIIFEGCDLNDDQAASVIEELSLLNNLRSPNTAIINIGPSYDRQSDEEGTHIKALEALFDLPEVDLLFAGGYASVYSGDTHLAPSHIIESHDLAMQIINELFENVLVYNLPGNMLVIVGRGRKVNA